MASDRAGGGISEELEREYNLRLRHPERDEVYRGFAARSAAYRDRVRGRLDLRYAAGDRCTIDFFPPDAPAAAAPLLVFIHGGYWRALDKRTFSFIASPFTAAGAAVALIGYDLAPAVTLTRIVRDTEQALAWLARSDELRFDRRRVVASGHSAGGHLAAMLGAASSRELGGLIVTAVVGVSGLFDLEPLLATSVNLDVRMTPDEARRLSPIHCTSFRAGRFVLAVGELETAGFIGQSRAFAAHVERLGGHATLMTMPRRTHFDVLDDLGSGEAPLARVVLDLLA